MATVLVAVALLAASIWIAIRMESGLDIPVRQALPADTDMVRPVRCRFQPMAGYPAARPVRCTQRSPQHMARLRHHRLGDLQMGSVIASAYADTSREPNSDRPVLRVLRRS